MCISLYNGKIRRAVLYGACSPFILLPGAVKKPSCRNVDQVLILGSTDSITQTTTARHFQRLRETQHGLTITDGFNSGDLIL